MHSFLPPPRPPPRAIFRRRPREWESIFGGTILPGAQFVTIGVITNPTTYYYVSVATSVAGSVTMCLGRFQRDYSTFVGYFKNQVFSSWQPKQQLIADCAMYATFHGTPITRTVVSYVVSLWAMVLSLESLN